jgi:hypothetical protein
MRVGIAILLGLVSLEAPPARTEGPAKAPGARYGITLDLKAYPQSTAKEGLASALKAIDAKRIDYLAAQLADPTFIDERVKRVYGGRFAEQVEDTRASLDPLTVKQLRKFLTEGDWTIDKAEAVVKLKSAKDRCVRLRMQDGRWFLVHLWAPPKAPKD